MFDFFERGFLATVGMLSLTRDKTQEMVDELVQRGDLNREEGKKLVEKMVQRGQEERDSLRTLVRQEVHSVLNELDLVSRKDIKALDEKIEALLHKLEQA